jgi:hypothetical protein
MERALALRDVLHHVVDVATHPSLPIRQLGKRNAVILLLCGLLLAASAYSWVARPEHIWGPTQSASPVVERASARLTIFILAQRLESQRAAAGHYPTTLEALGEQINGVSYSVIGDSLFELRATGVDSGLVFRSNESAEAFLGRSVDLINRQPR